MDFNSNQYIKILLDAHTGEIASLIPGVKYTIVNDKSGNVGLVIFSYRFVLIL